MDDRELLARAVELARRCPPSDTAFSVGALVVDMDGTVLADGWSRRSDPKAVSYTHLTLPTTPYV